MRTRVMLFCTVMASPGLAEVPSVVTGTPVVQSLVSAVMGDLGAPQLLMDRGGNPHGFQMRPSQARALAGADLLFWIGPELTPWLGRAIDGTGVRGSVVTLLEADGLGLRDFGHDHGHAHGDDHADDHGHDHEHAHDDHADDHGHDHEHARDDHADDHGHDHEHAHDDDHADDHGHDHEHAHDDHADDHGHDHEHAHDDDHADDHGHDHEHAHDDDHADDHGHDHEHAHDDHADDHGHDHGHAHDDHADDHGHDHAEDDRHDHSHDGVDPHAWLDPHNARVWIDVIAAELSARDAANAGTYAANAAAARAEITRIEAEVRAKLEPVGNAPVVVFHDAYGYFAAHFGVNVAGTITLGDAAAPGAARLAALRDMLSDGEIACIFPEVNHSSRYVDVVVEGTGTRVGGMLDPAGMLLEPGAALYGTLMTDIATTIADCVTGG